MLYEIKIDNDGDADADVTYQFRFHTKVRNPDTFLYNTGQITSLDSASWNRRQFYSVTKIREGHAPKVIAKDLPCPPCNIGPRSTPHYPALASAAVHHLPSGETVFAGQRREGFYVDLGAIFDLGDLRPFQNLHLIPSAAAVGVNATKQLNVHTIALQVPKKTVSRRGVGPSDVSDPHSVIGVWASASRQKALMHESDGRSVHTGPWMQVSRLGNPLFNEVIVPMGDKDRWNALHPKKDSEFLNYVLHPELAALLPILYPGVFPNLAGLSAPRADLEAILADRHTLGDHPRVPELHRNDPGRRPAPQHGDPACVEPQHLRDLGRGPGRLSERPARLRRRRDDRAASRGGSDVPVGE